MARVVLIFVDGMGLGDEAAHNPLVSLPTPGISSYLKGRPLSRSSAGTGQGEALLLALDASLGIGGLPQSATGQASLFTGENGAALLGRHLKGFPNGPLRGLLKEKGILGCLRKKGFRVAFANAFRPTFFARLEKGMRNFSCSTMASYYAGLPFRTMENLEEGRALYADITNETLKEQGYPVPVITPAVAALRMAALAADYHFILFEYFLTDRAGHSGKPSFMEDAIQRLDAFMGALKGVLPRDSLLILTSDHGNIEDMRVRDHTRNPVPALIRGPMQGFFEDRLRAITHVAPAIIRYLEDHGHRGRWRPSSA